MLPSQAPASKPRPKPSTPPSSQAVVIRTMELKKRSPMTLATGASYTIERPRSPCTALEAHLAKRTGAGSFRPHFSAIRSRCSGLNRMTSALNSAATGSTGDAATSVKAPNATSVMSTTSRRRRFQKNAGQECPRICAWLWLVPSSCACAWLCMTGGAPVITLSSCGCVWASASVHAWLWSCG